MTALQNIFLFTGALFGLLGIAAGAFGSHMLKAKLSPQAFDVFEIAVRYQMYHALSLIFLVSALGILPSVWIKLAGILFILGTMIFSGSLYLLIFSGLRSWGAVTPIGGILLILGWLSLIVSAIVSQFS